MRRAACSHPSRKLQNNRINGQAIAGLAVDLFHFAITLGLQDVFHLHGFDDGEAIAGLDLGALSDKHRLNETRHWAQQIL